MLVIGRNFKGVTGAEITAPGMDEPQPVVSVSVTADSVVAIVSSGMTDHLTLREDGTWAVDAQIRLLYDPARSAGVTVKSNPAKFTYEGPIIDSVAIDGSEYTKASAKTSERLIVTGRNFGNGQIGVDGASFFTGTGWKNADGVSYESPTRVIVETPNMVSSLPDHDGVLVFDSVLKVRYSFSDGTFVESNPAVISFDGYRAPPEDAVESDAANADGGSSDGGGASAGAIVGGLVVAGAAAAGGGSAIRRRIRPST
jgi:hypothetical protein